MKYFISLASVVLFSISTLWAQDAVDKIAVKTCSCLKQLDTTATLEEIEAKMGLCMFTEATPYEKELKKKNNIDISALNATTGEAFGKLIGKRMLIKCPEQMLRLGNVATEKKVERVEEPKTIQILKDDGPPFKYTSSKGILIDVVSDQFATFILKSSDGSEQRFLLLGRPQGADLLKNLPDLKGKMVEISYYEQHLYSPSAKGYITYKVIDGISLQ